MTNVRTRSRTFKVKLLVLLLALTAAVFLKSGLTDWLWLQDQNSCACGKRLSKDNLRALHRLNHSVEPFLTVNTNLSEEAFRWWKHIQHEQRDFSYYKSTVHKLFELLPPVADHGEPSSDSCRTCAVVGNSANLKGSRYGSLIDYQDVVMRMNAAPTKNYESDVGTKTTHRIMYPESAVDLDNSTHLVLFPFKINNLQWVIKAITTGFYGRQRSLCRSSSEGRGQPIIFWTVFTYSCIGVVKARKPPTTSRTFRNFGQISSTLSGPYHQGVF